jgi:putative tricarboxylic transport membrane protein
MESGTRKSSGDLWSGVVLALLGVYIVAQSWQWDYSTIEGPGPGFFPLWYGIAMLGLSVLLVVSSLRRAPARANPVDWPRIGRALGVWVALAASVALFKLVGFVVGFALLTYFIVAIMYREPPWMAAIVAAATAAGFYLVFDFALGLALPTGVFGF